MAMMQNNSSDLRNIALLSSPTMCSSPSENDHRSGTSALRLLDTSGAQSFTKTFQSEGGGIVSKLTKNRFDRLPLHKICCNRSRQSPETVLKKAREALSPRKRPLRFLRPRHDDDDVRASGERRDCFGMTPLHVLACSSSSSSNRDDPALYRLLVDAHPENLIARDVWGGVPLLYAVWGDAPERVVRLLVERQRSAFPDHEPDWTGMVETLGRARYVPGKAGASGGCIRDLLDAKRSYFPRQNVDWEGALTRWAKEDTERAGDSLAPRFHHDAFRYLITFGIADRVNSLGVGRWRNRLMREVNELRWFVRYRKQSTETIFEKLANYERMDQLREASTLLELALWKARSDDVGSSPTAKYSCRISCGADAVIPNVLLFL